MQNKFNLFISLLDVVKDDVVRDSTDDEGKNLIHVFAKYVKSVQAQQVQAYYEETKQYAYKKSARGRSR